jgi:plastocyanin
MNARAWLLIGLLSLPLAGARSADAGVIRGQVLLAAVPAAPSRVRDAYAGRASALPEPRVPERGLPQDAVIYIETLSPGVNDRLPAPTTTPQLAQQGQSFMPRVIAIPAGGSVDFPNLDPIYHSVFSVSPTKRFDLGRYGRGHSKSVLFMKPGLVTVYCDIHSNMEAFVLVAPNRAVARPDASGRYALPNLPPGRYNLRAWHPDMAPIQREVVVPDQGDVDLELRFAP